MAIYKNREVQILGPASGNVESPTYRFVDPYGEEFQARLVDVQVTEDEKKQLVKDNGDSVQVNVIKDKDLQELRDGQDPKKIEDRQSKEQKNKDVPVSSVKVNADEVARKAGNQSSVR